AQDAATLEGEAERIGYPLLIKAVAGGGGRGIRLVAKKADLAGELESAVREAKSSFGDGRVMLEKLVEQPRHIEVQVFGDSHGDAVHLYERDCSLQRRRQKVVEEAPAPGMPEDVRAAMTGAAVDLAKAVGYQGAGTVEFIVDGTRPLAKDTFFFLEMNTRLQVEHPVTELITGTDLVEWQLRVASGEKLPLKQGDIPLNGHAIEARICAEDPADNFRPGAGRLYAFNLGNVERLSESSAGAPADALDGDLTLYRLDSGFGAGDTVPAVYDSMIAKAIVKSWDRESAIDALSESLGESIIAGIPSNVGFLKRCLDHPVFRSGEHHVNWIAEEIYALTQAKTDIREAAGRLVAHALLTDTGDTPFDQKDGWRLNAPARRSIRLKLDGEIADIAVDERDAAMDIMPAISITDHSFAVAVDGDTVLVDIPDYEAEAEAIAGGDKVSAPMPGKVIDLCVQPGDEVTKDQTLAVMEAMKMEHSLKAPRDGVVKAVGASVGEQVAEGVMLVELEEV
ncbi:MAG TPA: ATP-grasp domain-containing protein, partial [Henriciella marina]|nr:ATP-grasp domain-containing protein [Henriciella marina]